MRYRFIFAIWVAGALIAGFAMGEIVQRDLYSTPPSQVRHHNGATITSGQDDNPANSVFSRC